jgi:hypothetical protein
MSNETLKRVQGDKIVVMTLHPQGEGWKWRKRMAEPKRVSPEEIYQGLKSGAVLLVCAYEDEAKFRKLQLQGAISLNQFKSKLPSLAKEQEIVFYCA